MPMIAGINGGPRLACFIHMLEMPPAAETLTVGKMESVDAAFRLLKKVSWLLLIFCSGV